MTPSAASGAAGPRRRGRPAGPRSGEARDRILAAARAEFAARGYDSTSVRSIGKAAGVDAALVHHYFGTKEQVFAAAIELSFAPTRELPDALAGGGAGTRGEQVVRFFLRIWEDPDARGPLLAIVRSAVSNETAAGVLRHMVGRTVIARVAGELDAPDAEFRVQLAAAQLVGMVMLRYVLQVEPLASANTETLVRNLAPTVQRYLTDPGVGP
ncbi:transcriptional regulator, TetR family [Actinacidiphila yanglinensis]|uniref:Transcriptional regulator, TetR family n=1 Tax=Actinacidiphila yanglinensis TaxID=310779 RepID=A0A1H6DUD5_9ACTN|nr:TetR family transcriptional regulator [Actinacidiphila yanglinensis]SEG88195.1 transcriptional regulator, TetR family [Actinacidiphila yanglinensis]